MNFKIKDLPLSERPREKLKTQGAKSLSDVELLSILFRTGTKDYSAKDLATNLLKEIDNLANLQDLSYNYLISLKGIKDAKALTLLAAIELGQRLALKVNQPTKITTSTDVYELLKYEIVNLKQEKLFAIFLNTKNEVISYQAIFTGTQNQSITHPREIFHAAIKHNAVKIIIAHNHPSGNVTPSQEDIAFTNQLKEASLLLQIPLLDHVILGNTNFYSFLEHKLL